MKIKNYFFCGVGGSGMSALALILCQQGISVAGSDRSRDQGQTPEKFAALAQAGIALFPQDGSGITDSVDVLVVSSAVEDSIPDVKRAIEQEIPIEKRAALLAELVNAARGICVGGTSGKTTVTGMIAVMLQKLGFEPSVMNGGQILDFTAQGLPGNALAGTGEWFVTETDESDGSVALFEPEIAVLNNITLDHKPLAELRPLFRDFVQKARKAAVVNLDDPEAAQLKDIHKNTVTFAIDHPEADITAAALGGALMMPGRHNVSNALAALAVAKVMDIPLPEAAAVLRRFYGIHRRFEIVGTKNGITVIDDFAHNPDKIIATLQTLKETPGRVIVIFQPHGFGPTKMLQEGLVAAFTNHLDKDDILIMPEIYYAGGTANKVISSRDITDAVQANGKVAMFMESRAAILDFLAQEARADDRVIVMGARDDTLPMFAQKMLTIL